MSIPQECTSLLVYKLHSNAMLGWCKHSWHSACRHIHRFNFQCFAYISGRHLGFTEKLRNSTQTVVHELLGQCCESTCNQFISLEFLQTALCVSANACLRVPTFCYETQHNQKFYTPSHQVYSLDSALQTH